MENLLQVHNLSITFSGQKPVEAVKDVSFSLRKGECLALVGESGSGKSVTAQAVLGLLPQTQTLRTTGEIILSGVDMLHAPAWQLRGLRGNRAGIIFQEPQSALNPLHTVEKQIAESLIVHGHMQKAKARERVVQLLEMVRIPNPKARLAAYPHQLSGGQRQRVMIAMALANNPDLLIADEPTTSLDVTVQAQILELLTALRRELGMALLLISHDLQVVRAHSDFVAVMQRGEIVEQGSTQHIFEEGSHAYTRTLLNGFLTQEPREVTPGKELLCTKALTVDFPLPRKFSWENRHFWKKESFRAVHELDVLVKRGQHLAIVGESGAGKSSFASGVLGLVPYGGQVLFAGRDVKGMNKKAMRGFRHAVQPVFQDPYASLNPRMSIGQIVTEGLQAQGLASKEEQYAQAEALLEYVGLDQDMLNRYPHEFSGGQRQRVAIARALAMKPKLMLLDEPTSSLDTSTQMQIVALLGRLGHQFDITYVFITHDLGLVRSLCHRVLVMHHGHVVEQGSVKAVLDSPCHQYTRQLVRASLGEGGQAV